VLKRPLALGAMACSLLVALASSLPGCVYDLDQLRGTPAVSTPPAVGDAGTTASGPDAPVAPVDMAPDGGGPDVLIGLPAMFPERPPVPAPMSAIAPADLVAYWPFDENQGIYAWDVTGNGNDGVLVLGASWRMAGFPAAAFKNDSEVQFDGISAMAEFYGRTIPDIDKPKSVSLWIRYDYEVDPMRPQALFVLLNRTKAAGMRIEFRRGRLAATTYNYTEIVGMPAPTLGWHHVVYTYDGNGHTLYLDGGNPVSSMMPAEVGGVAPPDGRTRVGRSSSSVDDGFRGFVDDVRVYKRALNAMEVKSLFLGTL
jgi:hypothetical protein